jgi:hypothetical protein
MCRLEKTCGLLFDKVVHLSEGQQSDPYCDSCRSKKSTVVV